MYQMKNPYMAEGGEPQIDREQAMVQQLIQAFGQLSPQGQQMFIQGLQQMMEQGQGQQEAAPQEQMMQEQMMQQEQPMQRMGGYNNPGFRSLPQSVQAKIMRNS